MDSYYLYQRQYREPGGVWKNTTIYSVDGWQTQPLVVAQIDPSECDEWNTGCKVTLTLEDCSEVCIHCDGSRSITRADLGEYKNRAVIAEFGCCIDTIDGVFKGDTKIQKVIIPDCITAITESSFYGTPIQGIVFPASITRIGSQAHKLSGLKWARFMGTTPPNLAAFCSLGGNCPIYVPPAYVNVYKTATIWNQYANRIFPWQGQVETDYTIECDVPGPDTGETGTTYEIWIEDGTGFTCDGTDKYHIEYAWTSSTGSEGSYVKTDRSRTGDLWETGSTDCGYLPPTPPSDSKFIVTLNNGTVVTGDCNGSSVLTANEMRGQYSGTAVSVLVGDCVSEIKRNAFRSYPYLVSCVISDNVATIGDSLFFESSGLTTVELPSGITTIDENTFYGCSSLTSITIPNGVTNIGQSAFYECSSLSSITIPNSVTTIGNDAFGLCSGLTSITLPSGLTSIGETAFDKCTRLTSINIPNRVTSISRAAFQDCVSLSSATIPNSVTTIDRFGFIRCISLSSITIPNSVTTIGEYAFTQCSGLTSITIPSGVTTIGGYAFDRCENLTAITVEATTPPTLTGNYTFRYTTCPIYVPCDSVNLYKTTEGWSSYKNRIQGIGCLPESVKISLNINDGTTYSGECDDNPTLYSYSFNIYMQTAVSGQVGTCVTGLSTNCFASFTALSAISIPQTVTDFGERSFANCSGLTSIDVPSGVTSIKYSTFNKCSSLTSVTLPYGLTSIGEYAFDDCSSLSSLTIPSFVTSIGQSSFFWCTNLTAINIPSGVTNIEYSTFYGCSSLTSVTISNGVASIGNTAFSDCYSLPSITIPDSVTFIDEYAFQRCSGLTSVNLPSGITSIKYGTFLGCSSLSSVTIPSGVTTIEGSAFNRCSGLTSVSLPDNVTTFGRYCFYNCSGITSFAIPSGVTEIGEYAFNGCRSLTSITVEATTPPTLGNAALGVTNNCPIYVPAASVDAYKAATNWSNYSSRIQAIPT